jgi:DNA-directed RNA polymerase subunit L
MDTFQDVKGSDKMLMFTLSPTSYPYANTLRRAMMTLVPTVGFRSDPPGIVLETPDIKVLKNDSNTQPNELLAHRISLIPIHADAERWDPERYVFKIDLTNEFPEPLDVKASDITVYERRKAADMSVSLVEVPGRDFFKPNSKTKDTCLITTLPGKRSDALTPSLTVEMRATVGMGREHSRFIPTCQASYSYTQDSNPEKRNAYFEKWLVTHKNVEPESLKTDETRRAELEREFKTMQIQRVYKTDERGDPNSFDFIVETIGTMAPRAIVERAMIGLVDMCEQFTKLDAGDLPKYITMRPSDTMMMGYDCLIEGQDHTFGNMIQTWLVDHHVDGDDNPRITFAGYKIPHPLKDEMLLRIGVQDNSEVTVRGAIAMAARGCKAMFEGWLDTWRGAKAKTASTAAAGKSVLKLRTTPSARVPAASAASAASAPVPTAVPTAVPSARVPSLAEIIEGGGAKSQPKGILKNKV